ncbi:MAG TPA: cytochrome c biogenesis protein CcdA [Firmicutes bacterium]|nr:cytochrome c biogenesis protein CcdA [Bacillota bacterium]
MRAIVGQPNFALEIAVSFGAGLASFFSPCILPLLPIYFGNLGASALQLNVISLRNGGRRELVKSAAWYCLGFVILFTALGLSSTTIGMLLVSHRRIIQQVSGIFMAVMGVSILGLLRWNLLSREWRPFAPATALPGKAGDDLGSGKRWDWSRSFVLGIVSATAWTPCTGPILASILALAASSGRVVVGAMLLFCYAAGMALPFLVAAAFYDRMIPELRRLHGVLNLIHKSMGALLLVVGWLWATGKWGSLP